MLSQMKRLWLLSALIIAVAAATGLIAMMTIESTVHAQTTAGSGSPSPHADSCALPSDAAPAQGQPTFPIFPPGQFPVKLPAASMLGARNDLPNPYGPGVHWGQLPGGRKWGSTAGVYAASDGTIWAIDRCGASGAGGTTCLESPLDPILQFDSSGKLLKSFGRGLIVSPHKITVDREGNVWVPDNGRVAGPPARGQQVYKFSPDGKLLLTLGKAGVAGPGLDELDAPTEVAVAPNGDIFVGDGHTGGGSSNGNARIMKFDRTGKFIKTWGKKGMGPGEFDLIHSVHFDSRGRLFVADRQNNRVQIFDQDGKFIDQWFQFSRPSGIYIDRNDVMYVSDSESQDGRSNTGRPTLNAFAYHFNLGAQRGVRIGSARDGKVTAFIPDPCPYPYVSPSWEGVTADAQGNVYAADYLGTVRKFVKRGPSTQ